MIESLKSEDTKKVFDQVGSRRLPRNIQATDYRRLVYFHASAALNVLAAVPGNHFEKLPGDRAGQYSIRINDRWRICFNWTDANNAANVEIVDYN